jgi:hypothetical protein
MANDMKRLTHELKVSVLVGVALGMEAASFFVENIFI